MKRNKYLHISAAALAMSIIAGGCADDTFDNVKGFDQDHEVTLTLRIPGFATPQTRAITNENALRDIKVFFVGATGEVAKESVGVDSEYTSDISNTRTVTLTVPAGTTKLQIVGNYADNSLSDATRLEYGTVNPNTASTFVFYGEESLENLQSGSNLDINLYRTSAKTTITSAVEGFEIEEAYFYGNPSATEICHVSTIDTPAGIPSDVTYSTDAIQVATDKLAFSESAACGFYHYEAAKDKCYWVVKGKGKGYYKIDYTPLETDGKTTAEAIPIIRNHHYKFTITKVNHDGYDTLDKAKDAEPENRMTVQLEDQAPVIYDMISCRDYYLGVSSTVEVRADADQAVIDIITDYKNGEGLAIGTNIVIPENNIVIKTGEKTLAEAADQTAAMGNAKLWQLTLPIEPNTGSNADREFKVIVKVGDLQREVTVLQKGANFFEGSTAVKVAMVNFPDGEIKNKFKFTDESVVLSPSIPSIFTKGNVVDYFSFLSSEDASLKEYTMKGETESEMEVNRGNGLHFSIYTDATHPQYEYWIPYNDSTTGIGERSYQIIEGAGLFQVEIVGTDSEQYLKVTPTELGNKNYEIWTGCLRVKARGKEVDFQIYHTGIFHKLDGAHQTGEKRTGWYYYEQVDVTSTDGETYHILDRNIGASSNKAYSTSGSLLRANTDAIGAYFTIPDRDQAITISELEEIMPAGFNKLPNLYQLAHMNVQVFNASEGRVGWSTSGNSQLSTIYLPIAGARDGATAVEQNHGYIWSGTVIQGNQGFFEGENEYGKWYRVLDINGNNINVKGTMRITSRSTGESRGLPVRLMQAPEGQLGWDLPNIESQRSRIILHNDARWDKAYIQANGGTYDKEQSGEMIAGDASKSWFYYEIHGFPTSVRFCSISQHTNTFTGYKWTNSIAEFSNKPCTTHPTFKIYARSNSWSNLRIHYWGGSIANSNWSTRPTMSKKTVNGVKWNYYEIPGDMTSLKFTDSNSDDGTNDYTNLQSFASQNKYELYFTNINNGGNVTCSADGGDTPTPPTGEYTTYRIAWNKSYDNITREYIWIKDLPTGTIINETETTSGNFKYNNQHESDSNYIYLDFKVPSSASSDTEISFYIRQDQNNSNNQKSFENKKLSEFSNDNGVKKYHANMG